MATPSATFPRTTAAPRRDSPRRGPPPRQRQDMPAANAGGQLHSQANQHPPADSASSCPTQLETPKPTTPQGPWPPAADARGERHSHPNTSSRHPLTLAAGITPPLIPAAARRKRQRRASPRRQRQQPPAANTGDKSHPRPPRKPPAARTDAKQHLPRRSQQPLVADAGAGRHQHANASDRPPSTATPGATAQSTPAAARRHQRRQEETPRQRRRPLVATAGGERQLNAKQHSPAPNASTHPTPTPVATTIDPPAARPDTSATPPPKPAAAHRGCRWQATLPWQHQRPSAVTTEAQSTPAPTPAAARRQTQRREPPPRHCRQPLVANTDKISPQFSAASATTKSTLAAARRQGRTRAPTPRHVTPAGRPHRRQARRLHQRQKPLEPAARATLTPTPAAARHEYGRQAQHPSRHQQPPVADTGGERQPDAMEGRCPPTTRAATGSASRTRAAACRQHQRQAPHPRQRQQWTTRSGGGERHPHANQRAPTASDSSHPPPKPSTITTPTSTRACARQHQLQPEANTGGKHHPPANAPERLPSTATSSATPWTTPAGGCRGHRRQPQQQFFSSRPQPPCAHVSSERHPSARQRPRALSTRSRPTANAMASTTSPMTPVPPATSAGGECHPHANASSRLLPSPAAARSQSRRQTAFVRSRQQPPAANAASKRRRRANASTCLPLQLTATPTAPSALTAACYQRHARDERPPVNAGTNRAQASRSSAAASPSPAGVCRHRRQAQAPSRNQKPPDAKPGGKRHPHAKQRSPALSTSCLPTAKPTANTSRPPTPATARHQRRRQASPLRQAAGARCQRRQPHAIKAHGDCHPLVNASSSPTAKPDVSTTPPTTPELTRRQRRRRAPRSRQRHRPPVAITKAERHARASASRRPLTKPAPRCVQTPNSDRTLTAPAAARHQRWRQASHLR